MIHEEQECRECGAPIVVICVDDDGLCYRCREDAQKPDVAKS